MAEINRNIGNKPQLSLLTVKPIIYVTDRLYNGTVYILHVLYIYCTCSIYTVPSPLLCCISTVCSSVKREANDTYGRELRKEEASCDIQILAHNYQNSLIMLASATEFQDIIGICNWLYTCRYDIVYTTNRSFKPPTKLHRSL